MKRLVLIWTTENCDMEVSMRITKGMINRHGGGSMLSGRKSLLEQVCSSRTGGSSRLSALKTKNRKQGSAVSSSVGTTAASRYMKTGYERLGKAAASLESQAESVGKKADGNLASATDVAGLLASYNDTLKSLCQCDGALNTLYRQTLKQAAADNLDALREIGVSYRADGSLSLDQVKFKGADVEKVKAALGSGSSFGKRLGAVASRVSDNAAANTRTASDRYNARGDMSSSYFSRYNFFS